MIRLIKKIIHFLVKVTFTICIIGVVLFVLNEHYQVFDWFDALKSDENKEEVFISQVRTAMLNGEEEITLKYVGKAHDMEWFTDDVINMIYEIDDKNTSDDYDYLKFKTESIYSRVSGYGNLLTVEYEFSYNETQLETEEVNNEIKKLLKKWKIEELSDYKKIKKIHDYIIKNASYDTNLEDYSAFDNLINKKSTCQGYISLAYKMFTEANIPCRIISGKGEGENHGWNIVKLNNEWYNMDITWDDPLVIGGDEMLVYDYFLKSDEDFPGHERDVEFKAEEFLNKYKISTKSYK
jgi:hypothetical protein